MFLALLGRALRDPLGTARECWKEVRARGLFHMAERVVQLLFVVCSAFAGWNALKLVMGNDMPVIVVLSGSMEPGFQRGDILTLGQSEGNSALAPGDIVVYSLQNRLIPIVHRVLERRAVAGEGLAEPGSFWRPAGPRGVEEGGSEAPVRDMVLSYVTKGDANPVHDFFLYTTGKGYVEPHEVVGRAGAYFPGLGYFTIAMREHLWIRLLVFGTIAAMALSGHSE